MFLTVAASIIDELIHNGIEVVFGIPGGAAAPLFDALIDRPELRYVNASHECGAVFMAMGYARATGKPAAVFTTAGPGITNAFTGIVSAYHERLPVIIVAGDISTSSKGKGAVQDSSNDFHSVQSLRPVTRYASTLLRPDTAISSTRRAITSAMGSMSGPTFLSVPFDVAFSKVRTPSSVRGGVVGHFVVDKIVCKKVSDLLVSSKRPLVLAGNGCRGSTDALVEFAEKYGVPVASTPKGKGVFPEDHPNAIGVIGLGGNPSAYDWINEELDIVVAIGTSLDDLATNAWTPDLRGSVKFIHIDTDASAIGRSYPVDIGIVGRAQEVCETLCSMAPSAPIDLTFPKRRVFDISEGSGLDGPKVAAVLNNNAPEDAIFTADMGEHLVAALHHLVISKKRDWFTALGFGAMGSGPCCAVGMQMAQPNRSVISIVGDGGFLMLNELATAVREKVPVTFIVFNDRRFNMVFHGLENLAGRSQEFETANVNFAKFAEAYGCEGVRVDLVHELEEVLATKPKGPRVIDAVINPAVRVPSITGRADALRNTIQGAH